MVQGRPEPPAQDTLSYLATVDVSGGGGADAFTFSIVHQDGDGESRRVVMDVMKGWRRARDLEGIVHEIAELLRRYRLGEVHGVRSWLGS